MFGGGGASIRLFNFRGVPVTISLFGLLLIGLFWVLPTVSSSYLQQIGANSLLIGVGLGVGLIVSIIIHELSHAIIGMIFGAKVISIQLDILGGATYFASKPISYFKDALLSLAGPASNFALWKICDIAGNSLAKSAGRSGSIELPYILLDLGFINLFLGIFNALPAYPLDGGQAVNAFVMGMTRNPKFAARVTLFTSLPTAAFIVFDNLVNRGSLGSSFGIFFILYIAFWIVSSSLSLYNQTAAPAKMRPTPRQQAERQRQDSEQRARSHPGQTFYEQGRTDLLAREYDAAVNNFSQAMQLEPKEMSYLDYRAYAYSQMGNYGQAIADYTELIDKNPKRADFYAARAQAYKAIGNLEAARWDVEQALNISPMENQALQLKAELNRLVS